MTERNNDNKAFFFFYDSYAVLAYVSGEKAYARYFDGGSSSDRQKQQPSSGSSSSGSVGGVLTKLNLMEVYFKAAKLHGHEAANQIIERFSKYLIDFDIDDIAGSMKLREELMKKKRMGISYVDALGYYLAKKMRIPFLTGDSYFQGLEGVKFVK
jgi:predicted nucleic acid-binding protein